MKKKILFLVFVIITGHFMLIGQQSDEYSSRIDCQARYSYIQDSVNLSLFNFYDQSIGAPTTWHWTFGDPQSGADNTSDLQNPLHQYTSSGVFIVCLTITNQDPLHPCHNSFCDTVVVDLTIHCHAYFYVLPDSTNPIHNTFKFFDNSTGSPNHFHWYFGDGSTSDLRNPIHHYTNSGNFSVCLKITRSDSAGLCTDSLCREVDVINYVNLGGHAFAGLFPINNPVNAGDTGIAYLYRINNSVAALTDTNVFFNLGYFTFPNTPEGQYILKVTLKPTSTHYQNYLPTYYPDALDQENAMLIQLSDSNVFNADIHLHPLNAGIPENYLSGGNIIISDPYPDPVSENLYLNITSSENLYVNISLISILGQKMTSYICSLTTGQNTIRLPVRSLPGGIYFIRSGFLDGSIIIVRKFVKH